MAVPFHISTLKNASKSDEGDFVMLRLNFITPGQAGGKKEDMVIILHRNGRDVNLLGMFVAFP